MLYGMQSLQAALLTMTEVMWDDDYDHYYRPDLRDWLSRC